MSFRCTLLAGSIPALLVFVGAAALQDKSDPTRGGPEDASGKRDMTHAMPRPTKEHEWLKERVGTWDCVVSCPMMGGPTKGTQVDKMFGEFWLRSEFEGVAMGKPFKGLMLQTFDPTKQKYVTTWCDTTMPSLMVMEGTTDASGKKLTSKGSGPDMEGKVVGYTNVLEVKGPDELLFTMYETSKGPDDPSTMKIEYKRRS
ncbi:MAG TPA: DUF1579 domain-containing protein [Planctomycetota bacterium]|nr:DUF1579 domain-containing protein [Planctomycetota bacterium]